MAKTYTQMWDAFFGGEFAGGTSLEDADTGQYQTQTEAFYKEIIGPTFLGGDRGEAFGKADLGGWYAAFDPAQFEQAEEIFRSSIGDPYIPGQDPFEWEKVSRYDTEGGDQSRIQRLLESQLYGQGKFLGGETGAEYGLETSRVLEDYTSGLKGEREGLTYGALTSGVGLASGTSGATLRSGEATAASEDVLIEAYKKAKSLGTDYRAGTEGVETTLEEDLDEALGVYLASIDKEKDRWFQDVMSNVYTFKKLEGEEYSELNEIQIAEKFEFLEDYEYGDGLTPQEWGCGYGQIADPENPGECMDDPSITIGEFGDITRQDTGVCGIGEIWNPALNDGAGDCEVRVDLELGKDNYGYLCPSDDQGLQECGQCGIIMDECGVCGGDGSSCEVYGCTYPYAENYDETATVDDGSCIQEEDEGPQCPQGQIKTETGNCIDDPHPPGLRPHQSCVETGCSQYGARYVCNQETGWCEDPGKWKPDKGPLENREDELIDDEQGCPGEEITCPYGRKDGLDMTVCDASFCNDEPGECQPCESLYEQQNPTTCECYDIWGGEEQEYS